MGFFAWRPPFPEALRGKETVNLRNLLAQTEATQRLQNRRRLLRPVSRKAATPGRYFYTHTAGRRLRDNRNTDPRGMLVSAAIRRQLKPFLSNSITVSLC